MIRKILVVEPDAQARASLCERLGREGFQVSGRESLPASAQDSPVDLVLLDGQSFHAGGIVLLERLRLQSPETEAIVLLGPEDAKGGSGPGAGGICHTLPKSCGVDVLLKTIQTVRQSRQDLEEARRRFGIAGMIATSPNMRQLLELSAKVARSEAAAVLLRGESGTGKDLLARAIHFESSRATRPFVTVLCTALQDTLLEDDLFGHEKGAFTDARIQKAGLFERADGGSIFLNEIGDMGPNLQSKLLRVLDEQTFRRVGGSEDIHVDVRVIAATHRDLEESIAEGRFRSDLFYRLNVFPITLPPLRERMEDLPLLAEHFLKRNARRYRRSVAELGKKAMAKLQGYDWPGNVRELRNVLERACVLSEAPEIQEHDLSFWRMGARPEPKGAVALPPGGVVLEDVERDLVAQALRRSHGNQTLAAALLGISRFRLRNRMKRYGLVSRPRKEGSALEHGIDP